MQNRKERRRATSVKIGQIDSISDIQVDAKFENFVMIYANAKGRKAVEQHWPGVQWTTDEKIASVHSPEWLFTHIRVTQLPPHFEKEVPLALCTPDSLGFAVANALRRSSPTVRVNPGTIFKSMSSKALRMVLLIFRSRLNTSPLALLCTFLPAAETMNPELSIERKSPMSPGNRRPRKTGGGFLLTRVLTEVRCFAYPALT
jgi:hypothetical protein